jgi:hypothetical protein
MGHVLRPRPLMAGKPQEGLGLREAMSDNRTQQTNAGRISAFLGELDQPKIALCPHP